MLRYCKRIRKALLRGSSQVPSSRMWPCLAWWRFAVQCQVRSEVGRNFHLLDIFFCCGVCPVQLTVLGFCLNKQKVVLLVKSVLRWISNNFRVSMFTELAWFPCGWAVVSCVSWHWHGFIQRALGIFWYVCWTRKRCNALPVCSILVSSITLHKRDPKSRTSFELLKHLWEDPLRTTFRFEYFFKSNLPNFQTCYVFDREPLEPLVGGLVAAGSFGVAAYGSNGESLWSNELLGEAPNPPSPCFFDEKEMRLIWSGLELIRLDFEVFWGVDSHFCELETMAGEMIDTSHGVTVEKGTNLQSHCTQTIEFKARERCQTVQVENTFVDSHDFNQFTIQNSFKPKHKTLPTLHDFCIETKDEDLPVAWRRVLAKSQVATLSSVRNGRVAAVSHNRTVAVPGISCNVGGFSFFSKKLRMNL